MGNDGGSIPTRRELVKNAARAPTISEMKAKALESLAHAWTTCPLSSEPLDLANAVSDWRGWLYNYESILKGLVPQDDTVTPELADDKNGNTVTFASTGIRSLKDVVKLKFEKRQVEDPKDKKTETYVCPISMKELGPGTRSVYVVPCGHVFAETAIKEIQEKNCPSCSELFEPVNVIPILTADEDELKALAERIEALRADGLSHNLRKDKGNKKKRKAENGDKENGDKKPKKKSEGRFGDINNPETASLTAKVVAELEAKNKRLKLAGA